MSCPAGSPSISAFAVKSVSGNASMNTARWMILKLSVVATSANMRAGRSASAQITAESTETSAGLDAVGDERAIGGAAQVRLGEAAGGGKCGRGRGRCQQAPTGHRQAHAHGSAPVAAGRRGCPPIVTQRGRLCDTFVTVDKDHAPVG